MKILLSKQALNLILISDTEFDSGLRILKFKFQKNNLIIVQQLENS